MTVTVTGEAIDNLARDNAKIVNNLEQKLGRAQGSFLVVREELEQIRLQLLTYEAVVKRLKENSDAAIRYLKMMPDDPEEPGKSPEKKTCPRCSRDLFPEAAKGAYYCPLGHGALSTRGYWRDY